LAIIFLKKGESMNLAERFNKIKNSNTEFFGFFGISLKRFHNSITGFDIIEFDNYLKNKYGDYEDGKTSTKDFIKKKFGKKAVNLIEKLISI